jgi:hypothetical protein
MSNTMIDNAQPPDQITAPVAAAAAAAAEAAPLMFLQR